MRSALASQPDNPPEEADPSPDPGAPKDSDRELVDRFRAGDSSGFDQLVRRYRQPIYYLAYRYLANQADAADLTQQVFVKVFRSLGGFRGASSVRSWIYRIAVNACLNHLRDHRREKPAPIPEEALVTPATGPLRLIADERARRLRRAITRLPPRQRTVLELRIYDDLRFREIADLVGCSENSAKVNFHHAVTRLRSLLDREPAREGS